ncbi:hypothetical protein J6590_037427 [Homalodisca vitripennis]|nr:hypothetical protein J6590_037427 [Homalodisca vitripennis]
MCYSLSSWLGRIIQVECSKHCLAISYRWCGVIRSSVLASWLVRIIQVGAAIHCLAISYRVECYPLLSASLLASPHNPGCAAIHCLAISYRRLSVILSSVLASWLVRIIQVVLLFIAWQLVTVGGVATLLFNGTLGNSEYTSYGNRCTVVEDGDSVAETSRQWRLLNKSRDEVLDGIHGSPSVTGASDNPAVWKRTSAVQHLTWRSVETETTVQQEERPCSAVLITPPSINKIGRTFTN